MKPTPLSEYLATPAENRAPGWVVVMRGAGAPSVVHASRGAAEAEASRLIEGLTGTVDQTALVMPITSVLTRKKDVRQPIVGHDFTLLAKPKIRGFETKYAMRDIVVQDGIVVKNKNGPTGGRATPEELAESIADEARVEAELARKPAALTVKPHGIYERRDGVIVGIRRFSPDGVIAMQHVGDAVYAETGRGNYRGDDDTPQDLAREIIVGEGWKPWNGGVMAAGAYEEVDVVFRNGTIMNTLLFECIQWGHSGGSSDIVAYREAMPF